MDHFIYKNGVLFAEDVCLTDVADAVGTPFYIYSTATLTRHYKVFEQALQGLSYKIFYAMKANSNLAVLRILSDLGAGMDVVSVGEYRRALRVGVLPERIVFSGVGKTQDEMRYVLTHGVRQFNVESEPELHLLNKIAVEMRQTAPIALRVNPDVDAKTHPKIATGLADNKFGIPIGKARQIYREASAMSGVDIVGIDVHIGSQIVELEPYRAAFEKIAALTQVLRSDGHNIRRLDLGGGLGIPYKRQNTAPPLPLDYGQVIRDTLGDIDVEIDIEPGRLIAGNAGLLVSKVIYNKATEGRDFLIIDAAMNDLIRPAMYEAYHDIIPVIEAKPGQSMSPVDIVGPICESGDTFAKARQMPPIRDGELVAFRSAGAYGAVMSSEYNSRLMIPELLVNGDQYAVIRKRPTFDEMINRDMLPEWLEPTDI